MKRTCDRFWIWIEEENVFCSLIAQLAHSLIGMIWDMDKFGFYKINNNKESKIKKIIVTKRIRLKKREITNKREKKNKDFVLKAKLKLIGVNLKIK